MLSVSVSERCYSVSDDDGDTPPSPEAIIRQLQTRVADSQPEGANAWPALDKAASMLVADAHRDAYYPSLFQLNRRPLDDFEQREHDATMRAYSHLKAEGLPELIDKATACSQLMIPLDQDSIHGISQLGRLRSVYQFQTALMREALDRSEAEEAAHHFEGALRLGSICSFQPGLIAALFSHATLDVTCTEIQGRLVHDAFPVAAAQPMLTSLTTLSLGSLQHVLHTETLTALAAFAPHFNANGTIPVEEREELVEAYIAGRSGDLGALFLQDDADDAAITVDEWNFPTWSEFEKHVSASIDDVRQRIDVPPSQWPVEDDEADATGARQTLFGSMPRSVARACRMSLLDRARILMGVEATRIMLGLALHHERTGRFPDSLDALVPNTLPELPADPINGKLFGYRLLDDDEHGRPYLLYSFGMDGIDNDGTQGTDRYAAINMDEAEHEGCDFVVNTPLDEWD